MAVARMNTLGSSVKKTDDALNMHRPRLKSFEQKKRWQFELLGVDGCMMMLCTLAELAVWQGEQGMLHGWLSCLAGRVSRVSASSDADHDDDDYSVAGDDDDGPHLRFSYDVSGACASPYRHHHQSPSSQS